WDPCWARVRSNRDCGRGFSSADVGRSANGLWKRPILIRVRLAIPGPCQCSPGLNLIPLYLLFILIGPGPNVTVQPRPKGLRWICFLLFATLILLKSARYYCLGGSGDSIDKLFNEGVDAGREHFVIRDDDVLEETISRDVLDVAIEKAKKKRKRKVTGDASGLVLEGSGIPSGVTEPLITASVAHTSDAGPTDSVSWLNLRTRPPNVRCVVSSNDSHHSGSYSKATSFVITLVADASIVTVAVSTTVVADDADVPDPKAGVESKNLKNVRDSASAGRANADVTNISKLNKPSTSLDSFYASQSLDTRTMHHVCEDPYVCHDLTDCLAPPALFTQLCAIDYDQLYFEFNVGATRQVCLGAEVRMRAKPTLEKKGELEDKCDEQSALLSERDAKIVHLKSLLSLKEAEAAKAIRLCGQLTTVKAADAAKGKAESASLSSQVAKLTSNLSEFQLSRDELNYKVASLESERDGLINQWFLTHGLKLVILKCLQSPKYRHALGLAIGCVVNKGIQDGLRAGVDHGKARRDLFVIEAYDPFAEAKYVEAVNALGTVDFSLLSELKSKKYASIVDLMDSIPLEGPLAEIPGAKDLQPSLEQLRLPIHRLEDKVVLGETSLSFSLQVVHSQVQRVKEEIMEKRLSLTDVMVPLA
nr:hypothetical protein [Tanacetum cinerariifolium]